MAVGSPVLYVSIRSVRTLLRSEREVDACAGFRVFEARTNFTSSRAKTQATREARHLILEENRALQRI